MTLLEDVALQIALPADKAFVLDSSALNRGVLGSPTTSAHLFTLGTSQLDIDQLGIPLDDPNTAWRDLLQDAQSVQVIRGASLSSTPLPQLQPGTLTVVLVGTNFDPASNPLIK